MPRSARRREGLLHRPSEISTRKGKTFLSITGLVTRQKCNFARQLETYDSRTMHTINEAQDEVIEEFGILPDWLDRYQQLIDLSHALPAPPDGLRCDANLIKGCQSRVWIQCESRGGILQFHADSDAIITKGIAALLIQVLNGHTPEEILSADLYMINRIGLKENLSPTRANGLVSMIGRIRECAESQLKK